MCQCSLKLQQSKRINDVHPFVICLKILPFQAKVVGLPPCLGASTRSAVPGSINEAPSPLSPGAVTISREHTRTPASILHAVFIGLNDKNDSFPCSKREGTSCQHGPLHLPGPTGDAGKGGRINRKN